MSAVDTKASGVLSRQEAEEFLYHEAALLDQWRLDEWLALFTDDGVYEVPNPGSSGDTSSERDLFLVADNRYRLGHRIQRLKNVGAHAEWPRSRCVRTVNNVRVSIEAGGFRVLAVTTTYRTKNNVTDNFFGHSEYLLTRMEGGLRICFKRVMLAIDTLDEQGRVSIIL